MKWTIRHSLLGAVAVALASYYLFARSSFTPLQFQDRKFPQGFRELVLDRGVSQPNPIFGIEQRANAEARPGVKEICDALWRDPNSPAAGDAAAPVRIATFLDYRCPYCKTLSAIMDKLPADNARVVFHEWAILGEPSLLAARAALAADRQGKYAPFHARLMNARRIPTAGYIDAIAAELGLDVAKLHTDLKSESIALALRRTASLAATLGFAGTPALVVGRTIVQGEISRSQLERLIALEAQPAAARPC